MNFDYPTHGQPPAFSNPWSSSPSPSQTAAVAGSNLYVGGPQPPSLNHNLVHKSHSARAPTSSAPPLSSYASMPVHTTAAGTLCLPSRFYCDSSFTVAHRTPFPDLLNLNRLQTSSAAYADATYATTASPVHGHFAPPSATPYDALGYAPAPVRPPAFSALGHETDASRRFSQQ